MIDLEFYQELKILVEKSENAGIIVEAVIGDDAYSEGDNLEYCKQNNIKLASKLSKSVSHGNGKNQDDFEYNKNSQLKSNFGYDKANATGKVGITIQGATTLFLVNIKRIIKLKEEKVTNIGEIYITICNFF